MRTNINKINHRQCNRQATWFGWTFSPLSEKSIGTLTSALWGGLRPSEMVGAASTSTEQLQSAREKAINHGKKKKIKLILHKTKCDDDE
jgi:hypothetical protein